MDVPKFCETFALGIIHPAVLMFPANPAPPFTTSAPVVVDVLLPELLLLAEQLPQPLNVWLFPVQSVEFFHHFNSYPIARLFLFLHL